MSVNIITGLDRGQDLFSPSSSVMESLPDSILTSSNNEDWYDESDTSWMYEHDDILE